MLSELQGQQVDGTNSNERIKQNKVNFGFFLDGSVPHSCSLVHGTCCAGVRAERVEIING